jgi:hypothetical protein
MTISHYDRRRNAPATNPQQPAELFVWVNPKIRDESERPRLQAIAVRRKGRDVVAPRERRPLRGQLRECAVELRVQFAKPGSEIRGGTKVRCGIGVLGNDHNASIVRCLSSDWAFHGRESRGESSRRKAHLVALICFSSFSRRAMIESKVGGSPSNMPSPIIFS